MGEQREFICPTCGYTALVSGSHDCGMEASTATILCYDCRELFDVTTAALDGEGPPVEGTPFREVPIRCPNQGNHRFVFWSHPGAPCPHCGRVMMIKPDGQTVMWD